jgi:hypothetical protein
LWYFYSAQYIKVSNKLKDEIRINYVEWLSTSFISQSYFARIERIFDRLSWRVVIGDSEEGLLTLTVEELSQLSTYRTEDTGFEVSCLFEKMYVCVMLLDTVSSSETSINLYQTRQYNIPEDSCLNQIPLLAISFLS